MADDIDKLCSKVTLIGGERNGITISEGEVAESREQGDHCLVGKIRDDRKVNKEAFKTVLMRLWRIVGSVVFKEVEENLWVFEFSDKDDKERILAGRPWSFDRQIILLNELDGNVPLSQMQFTHSPLQVHDLPLVCMNKSVGTKIGESLGSLLDVDVAGDGVGWGHCLCIRVVIDLRNPLERGRAIHLNGKSHWVTFKYEKLPMFYFTCGKLLHGEKRCTERKSSRQHGVAEEKQWGVWLRADLGRRKFGVSGGGSTGPTEEVGADSQAGASDGRWPGSGICRGVPPSGECGWGPEHSSSPTPSRLQPDRGEAGGLLIEHVTEHLSRNVGDGQSASLISRRCGRNQMAVTRVMGVGHRMVVIEHKELVHDDGATLGDSVESMGVGHDSEVPGGGGTVEAQSNGLCPRDRKVDETSKCHVQSLPALEGAIRKLA
jgi:hypothetical protein